jgi:hypothetical protein
MEPRFAVLGSIAEALFPEGPTASRHGIYTVPQPLEKRALEVIETRLAPSDSQALLL